ncbi:hypothetical protein NCC49_004572 [Naganishia albida]|nr:hypothetical protein NCC49_004572 [Naganishia albida]
MDETGFRVGIGGRRKIVGTASQKKRNHYIASESDRESLTVTECINGAGSLIPPMIIFGCENILAKMLGRALQQADVKSSSRRGVEVVAGEWAYLALYGSIHREIIVVKMPQHLTHLLQSLDQKVFSPYKAYHRQHVNAAALIGLEHYEKTEFLNDLASVRKQTFKSSTIMSAWKAAGIIPWNPNVVLNKMVESPTLTQAEAPSTPSRSAPRTAIKTPTTVRTLQRTGNMITKIDRNAASFRRSSKGSSKDPSRWRMQRTSWRRITSGCASARKIRSPGVLTVEDTLSLGVQSFGTRFKGLPRSPKLCT